MRIILLPILTLWISGCSLFGGKDSILPQDGPTMLEIYHGHFAGDQPQAASHGNQDDSDQQQPVIVFGQRHIHTGTADSAGQPRAAADQLNQRFARLANPTLVLYVFPHLGTDNQYPIPGYSTAFPLYEQVYYALPGETEHQP